MYDLFPFTKRRKESKISGNNSHDIDEDFNEIGDAYFLGREYENVHLKQKVTKIGKFSFALSKLKTITFEEFSGLTFIDNYAFYRTDL